MIVGMEVTTSVYRLSQNQQTKLVEYYRFNQLIKTEQAEKLYSQEELFEKLCQFAYAYNVKEELNSV